jgi:hypothetical protein
MKARKFRQFLRLVHASTAVYSYIYLLKSDKVWRNFPYRGSDPPIVDNLISPPAMGSIERRDPNFGWSLNGICHTRQRRKNRKQGIQNRLRR